MLSLLQRSAYQVLIELHSDETLLHMDAVEVYVGDGSAIRVRRELLCLDEGCSLDSLQIKPIDSHQLLGRVFATVLGLK